jgi:hypothetical protein
LVASTSTVTSGYSIVFVAIVLMGSGMGLTIAPATESIMGSLPKEKAGVGSAVNDTTRELGGALGVAVIGSIMSSVYTAHLTDAAAGRLPDQALDTATSSVGAALAVAQRIGPAAEPLVNAARQAFVDGMVIGSRVTAVVAVLGALVALKWLPARAQDEAEVVDVDVIDVDAIDVDAEMIQLCDGQVATAEAVAADL